MSLKDQLKIAKLCRVRNASQIKDILKKEGDINYIVAENSYLKKHEPHLLGGSCYHFTLDRNWWSTAHIFEILLESGADFTIKNHQGRTVLHQVIHKNNYYVDHRKPKTFKTNFNYTSTVNFELIDLILLAQVKSNNFDNPRDDYGITHYHAACLTNNVKAVRFFLKNGVSVNDAVNVDAPIFSGYTPLHFASSRCYLETIEVLLKNGANVHLQDSRGLTPIHIVLEQYFVASVWKYERWHEVYMDLKIRWTSGPALNLLLSKTNNFYVDTHGLSCLHLACCTNDTNLVRIYMKRAENLNQAISMNAPLFPGFTPLHFAALFNLENVKLLLAEEADILAKDKYGVTPFDICVEEYCIEIIHYIISISDKLRTIVLSDEKTKLADVVIAMRKPDEFFCIHKINPNRYVPTNSPVWPGFTILHLAVVFSDRICDRLCEKWSDPEFKMLEKCLHRKANPNLQDVNGFTPLHLAFRQQKFQVVNFLLDNYHNFIDIVDNENLSHLHISCVSRNKNAVEKLSSCRISIDKSTDSNLMWIQTVDYNGLIIARGSTALHIASMMQNFEFFEILLKQGADLYAIDSNGFTPIHLMFLTNHSYVMNNFDFMFTLPDLNDYIASNCGLSHLHIAVIFGHLKATEKLLSDGANVNQQINFRKTTKPIYDYEQLFSAHSDHTMILKLSHYDGYTPLHFAIDNEAIDLCKLLLQYGADILARDANGKTPLSKIFYKRNISTDARMLICNSMIDHLISDEILRKRVEECTGMTMLHLACRVFKTDLVEQLLLGGVDVNAKIFDTGYTPLHASIEASLDEKSSAIVKLLLLYGADVMMTNTEGDTPVLMLESLDRYYEKDGIPEHDSIFDLLLESQQDFSINPVNSRGLSHFHVACSRNHLSIIKKFLKYKVEINSQLNYFYHYDYCGDFRDWCGFTPLHLALITKSRTHLSKRPEVIDLLIMNGADVNVEDTNGNTALHFGTKHEQSRHVILERLIQAGADIHRKNIAGDTPFEVLLHSKNVKADDFKCFLNRGYKIDDYNTRRDVSYFSMIIEAAAHHRSQNGIDEMLKVYDVTQTDAKGRTVLQNTVLTWMNFQSECPIEHCRDECCVSYYVSYNIIQKLVKLGCDIDHQDHEGKTALHMAVEIKNESGVAYLLKNGCDINIMNTNSKLAWTICIEIWQRGFYDDDYYDKRIALSFLQHIHMLSLFKLEIKRPHHNFQIDFEGCPIKCPTLELEQKDEMQTIESCYIGSSSIKLVDLLSETCFVSNYPHFSILDRQEIEQFFKTIDENRFFYTVGLLRLQYRKALKRSSLIKLATNSLQLLIEFQLPELCCEAIFKFLSNGDLNNIIATNTNCL